VSFFLGAVQTKQFHIWRAASETETVASLSENGNDDTAAGHVLRPVSDDLRSIRQRMLNKPKQ
jgi:hypothetical protein